jgi:two-component system, NtrC family, sensor kinase
MIIVWLICSGLIVLLGGFALWRAQQTLAQVRLEQQRLNELIAGCQGDGSDRSSLEKVVGIKEMHSTLASLQALLDRQAKHERTLTIAANDKSQEIQGEYLALQTSLIKAQTEVELLEKTKSQLAKAEKLTGLVSLAAGFAHEFRNPLNFLNGHLRNMEAQFGRVYELLWELTADTDESTEVRSLFERPRESVALTQKSYHEGQERIEQLLKSLAGFVVPKGKVDLSISDAMAPLTAAISAVRLKSQDVTFDFTEDGMPPIVCDPAMLESAFREVLNNARYASLLNADAKDPQVTVWTAYSDHMIIVSIKDSGRGLKTGIEKRMFEPFFTNKPPGDGVGMGLTTALQITEGHNGKIRVSSAPGEGATFELIFPTEARFEEGLGEDAGEATSDEIIWL